MGSSPLINLDDLLAPLAGDSPVGKELRYDAVYDQIKEARSEGNRDMLEGGEDKVADWSLVIQVASEALQTRSKDLMLAGWLAEALMARHGFAGLRDGFQLITGLMERYWDEVYPQADGDDLEPRVAPLVWLLTPDRGARLANRLRDVPLLPDSAEEYSWTYWKSRYCAPRRSDESDSSFQERQEQAVDRERKFEAALQVAPLASVTSVYEDLQSLREAFLELDKVSSERFGKLAPGVSGFRTTLDEIGALVRRMLKDKGGVIDAAVGGEVADGAAASSAAPAAAASAPAAHQGPIQSRDDAFRRLAEVAEYLRRTEPQSPIPLLIDRAINWGKMPFHKLLREIVRDNSARDQVRDLLGIHTDDDNSDS